ncbi:MAG: hypothetical protein AAF939_10825 [Planctomycetota bacterium]
MVGVLDSLALGEQQTDSQKPFDGFERPDATFVMCPNEFLDILIPNHSRGCVRLVSFVLYETFKWLKEDGTPN